MRAEHERRPALDCDRSARVAVAVEQQATQRRRAAVGVGAAARCRATRFVHIGAIHARRDRTRRGDRACAAKHGNERALRDETAEPGLTQRLARDQPAEHHRHARPRLHAERHRATARSRARRRRAGTATSCDRRSRRRRRTRASTGRSRPASSGPSGALRDVGDAGDRERHEPRDAKQTRARDRAGADVAQVDVRREPRRDLRARDRARRERNAENGQGLHARLPSVLSRTARPC